MEFDALFDSLGQVFFVIFGIAIALYILRIFLLAGTCAAIVIGLIFLLHRKRKRAMTTWFIIAAACLLAYLLLSIIVFQQIWLW